MKTIVLVLTLTFGMNAFADDTYCVQVLNNMASMISDYTSMVRTCQSMAPTTDSYRTVRESADSIASAYDEMIVTCHLLCAGNPSALEVCDGRLKGACP